MNLRNLELLEKKIKKNLRKLEKRVKKNLSKNYNG